MTSAVRAGVWASAALASYVSGALAPVALSLTSALGPEAVVRSVLMLVIQVVNVHVLPFFSERQEPVKKKDVGRKLVASARMRECGDETEREKHEGASALCGVGWRRAGRRGNELSG